MTCILSFRIPGPRAETATKINRLSIYINNPWVDMRPKPQSFGIRKGTLHTSSGARGLSRHRRRQQAYRIGPIMALSWILDGSLLYEYIVGGGPFDTACAQARLILRCKNENRMSLL